MEKEKNENKTIVKKNSIKVDPVLKELGMVAARGLISGLSFKMGGLIYDKTFNRPKVTLQVLPGGKNVVNG